MLPSGHSRLPERGLPNPLTTARSGQQRFVQLLSSPSPGPEAPAVGHRGRHMHGSQEHALGSQIRLSMGGKLARLFSQIGSELFPFRNPDLEEQDHNSWDF